MIIILILNIKKCYWPYLDASIERNRTDQQIPIDKRHWSEESSDWNNLHTCQITFLVEMNAGWRDIRTNSNKILLMEHLNKKFLKIFLFFYLSHNINSGKNLHWAQCKKFAKFMLSPKFSIKIKCALTQKRKERAK